jgi:hypothetical protein
MNEGSTGSRSNEQAENSHVPRRKRERTMQSLRSRSGVQRFVSIFSAVRNLLVPSRSHRSAFPIRPHRLNATAKWKAISPRNCVNLLLANECGDVSVTSPHPSYYLVAQRRLTAP